MLSTSASSGAGADWEPGDPAPTTRSFSSRSSGLGPSISARGYGRWINSSSPAGSPASASLGLPPQASLGTFGDIVGPPNRPIVYATMESVPVPGQGGQPSRAMPHFMGRDCASGGGSTCSWSSSCAAPLGHHRATPTYNVQEHPRASTATSSAAAPTAEDVPWWVDRIPQVYAKAITNIQSHGWRAVHPKGELPVWTVLHWAAAEDHADICLQLLEADADPLCVDEQGLTPLDYAHKAAEAGASGGSLQVLEEAAQALSSGPPAPEVRRKRLLRAAWLDRPQVPCRCSTLLLQMQPTRSRQLTMSVSRREQLLLLPHQLRSPE